MIMVFGIIGALFRRFWGEGNGGPLGWPGEGFKAPLKRVLGYALAFLFSYITTQNLLVASLMALIIGTGWMAFIPPGHAYGTWMGNGGEPDSHGRAHTILKDFLALWLCYFLLVTLPAGLIWKFFTGDNDGLLYAGLGLLVPLPYFLAKKVFEYLELDSGTKMDAAFEEKPIMRVFLGGHTVIGELFLGFLIYGGLALQVFA